MTALLKLEVGKYYKTRDRRIVQIIEYHPDASESCKYSSGSLRYSESGEFYPGHETVEDLIEEYGTTILPRNNLSLQGLILKTITVTACFTPEQLDRMNYLEDSASTIAASSENIIAVHFVPEDKSESSCLDNFEKYSANWIRQLTLDKNARFLVHHACSICRVNVGYILDPNNPVGVVWDGNCGCPSHENLRQESWDTIERHLKRQPSDEIRDKIMEGLI